MNIKIACTLIMVVFPLSLYASVNKAIGTCKSEKNGMHCQLSSSGTLNLSQARHHTHTKNILFTVNNNVSGVLKLHQVSDKNIIKGTFLMDNSSTQKSYIQYRVILKDKVGVIAQSKGEIHLAQGKNQKIKFGSMVVSPQDMKNISTYQIQIVSSNKKTH